MSKLSAVDSTSLDFLGGGPSATPFGLQSGRPHRNLAPIVLGLPSPITSHARGRLVPEYSVKSFFGRLVGPKASRLDGHLGTWHQSSSVCHHRLRPTLEDDWCQSTHYLKLRLISNFGSPLLPQSGEASPVAVDAEFDVRGSRTIISGCGGSISWIESIQRGRGR